VSNERLWHKRDDDFEAFDKITLEVVPRYKTSGLSGDEWRTSVVATFWFKGEKIHEHSWTSMRYAIMLLAHEWVTQQEPIPERVIELEEPKCDQPGCAVDAVARFVIKRETSDSGEWLDTSQSSARYFRKFCKRHVQRGDCSREDCDENYEPLDAVTSADSSNAEESPSVLGGVLFVDVKDPERGGDA
jgi:hypothetical protein